jgi:predicted branched-subunit amino acid permease
MSRIQSIDRAPATAGPALVAAAAVRDTLPVGASIAPLGLVIGATAARAGVPAIVDMVAAAAVFAGAAHLAALTLLAAGAGALAALGTAVLVNVRLLLYSASIEPRFREQPRWFRWLGPALLIDQTYFLVAARDDLDDPARFRRYWLTAGALLLGCWVTSVGMGSVLGPLLPAGSPLDAAAVLVLVGMLAPRLKAWRPAVVALVALVVAVVAAPLPGGVGLLSGLVAGGTVGAVLDRGRR